MANEVTLTLQNEIKAFMATMLFFQTEAPDIEDLYFKGGVSTAIAGLGGTDPVTVTSKLTKDEMTSGITFVQELDDFYTNASVTTSDYNSTCQNIIYGNDPAVSPISTATEAVGDRLVVLCGNAIDRYKQGADILGLYQDNEINDIVSVLDNQRVMPGASMTRDDLNLAVTMIEQYRNMIGNAAVTTGDYGSTVSKWQTI